MHEIKELARTNRPEIEERTEFDSQRAYLRCGDRQSASPVWGLTE